MLKVLTKRIEAKAKHLLRRNQFGFRKGCGTREAVVIMRTLCERSLEYGNEVYICFVDFEKEFDRVNWVKMFEILKSLHIHEARGGGAVSGWRFRSWSERTGS